MPRVLVTGYGGFLGQSICRQLLGAGHSVRGMARNVYPTMRQIGVESIVGDASSLEACRKALQNIDVVMHTAAIAGVWGKRSTFETINVKATENLLQAAHENSVQAFVHCSSPSVTFDGQPQSGIDESVPYPTSWLCDYPRTKAIAEQKVLAANQSGKFLTCALRPHLIWGEGDPHLIPRVIQKCKSKQLRCVGDGTNLIDTVHVESAAHAHLLAMKALLDGKEQAAGRAYFITDGAPIECWHWISLLLVNAGLIPPTRRLSMTAAYRIGHLMELGFRAFQISREPPMTRFVAAQLGVDHYFSIEAARKLLGYNPVVEREKTLALMSPWLRKLAE
jgi:2-alkyl-3-oxoalkanoate reductase